MLDLVQPNLGEPMMLRMRNSSGIESPKNIEIESLRNIGGIKSPIFFNVTTFK